MTQTKREGVIATFAKPIKTSEVSKNRKANVLNIAKKKPLVGPPTVMLISLKVRLSYRYVNCGLISYFTGWSARSEVRAICESVIWS